MLTFIMIQQISVSNKSCSFEFSFQRMNFYCIFDGINATLVSINCEKLTNFYIETNIIEVCFTKKLLQSNCFKAKFGVQKGLECR